MRILGVRLCGIETKDAGVGKREDWLEETG
jgi:hypothetical protein